MYSSPAIVAPRPTPIMISSTSLECLGDDIRAILNSVSPASNNYPAANVSLFLPFGVAEPITVVKLWVANGTAVAGNIDLGIFNPDGTMVVGKGSTAQATTNDIQELDITDTVLQRGRYYLGITSNTSGATQKMQSFTFGAAGALSAMGVLQINAGPPLASGTFLTCTQLVVPYFGLTARTLVA